MSDAIKIEPVNNGAVLEIEEVKTVWAFDEDDPRGLVEMLQELVDYVHPGTAHDEQRIMIRLVHGEKYGPCPGCSICKPEETLHEC